MTAPMHFATAIGFHIFFQTFWTTLTGCLQRTTAGTTVWAAMPVTIAQHQDSNYTTEGPATNLHEPPGEGISPQAHGEELLQESGLANSWTASSDRHPMGLA